MGIKRNHELQNTITDIVTMINGVPYTTSKIYAWEFHKLHKNVIRTIEKLVMDMHDTHCSDECFVLSNYLDKQGKRRKQYLVSRDGFILLSNSAGNDRDAVAKKLQFMKRFDSISTLNEIDRRLSDLEKKLHDSGIITPWTNPRYKFDHLKVMFKDTTGDDTPRGFYDAIGDWLGIAIPRGNQLSITVRDWILEKIPMDKINELVIGVQSGVIEQSNEGHWVHLGGFDSNTVEWAKMVKEFGGKCAYCGKEKPLLPEHIVPQTVMSEEHPEHVDLMSNVVPSCSDCNHSKLKKDWAEWYKRQPFYSESRYRAILKHIRKYKIS